LVAMETKKQGRIGGMCGIAKTSLAASLAVFYSLLIGVPQRPGSH
jgi:hypothetical protein